MGMKKKPARAQYAFRTQMRHYQESHGKHKYPLRDPDDEDEGGSGGGGFKRHPLLDDQAQFSRSNEEATLPTDRENLERIEQDMRSDDPRFEFTKQLLLQLNQKLGKGLNINFRPPGM